MSKQSNPFTMLTKSENLATNIPKPVFWQSNDTQSAQLATSKPAPKNLFEHLIKKSDQQDMAERKEKQLTLKSESLFQSLHLELVREVVNEFYQVQQETRHIPLDLTNMLIDSVINSEIRKVYNEIVPMVKSAEHAERMQKQMENQRRQESMIHNQQVIAIINFDTILFKKYIGLCEKNFFFSKMNNL